MTRITDWTGGAGDGLWFDPGNWSAGVPGRQTPVEFQLPGKSTTDVSLAPANFQHPVAGSVSVDTSRVVFEPGKLTITHAGLLVDDGARLTIARGAVVDAHDRQGAGVSVANSAKLNVHGVVRTDGLNMLGGPNTLMLVSGAGARTTVSGQAIFYGTVQGVDNGATFAANSLQVYNDGAQGGRFGVSGAGTLARIGNLTVLDSSTKVTNGARLEIGGGSERSSGFLPSARSHITIAHGGATLQLEGTFNQQAGTLTVGQGGYLELGEGAAFGAHGMVELAGGTITGPGAFVLTSGTLRADTMQTLNHAVGLSGTPLIEAVTGDTLRLDGAISGGGVQIGAVGETGTVVLTNPADSYGGTDLAGGTLELAANDVTGTGSIRFLPGDTATLKIDPGVSVGNTLLGFGAGDTIDLAGIGFGPHTTLDLVPRPLGGATLTVSDGTNTEHLVLGTVGNPAGYTLSADGHGGTDVGYVPPPQAG